MSFVSVVVQKDLPQRTPRTRRKKRLLRAYKPCILIHMRTTLNIDDNLVERASELTGIHEKTALVRKSLEALISLESAKRLAAIGGSEKRLRPIRRRRSPRRRWSS